jgi:hypothetical protein
MQKKYCFALSRIGVCFTLSFLLLLGRTALAAEVTLAWDPNSETDLAGYGIYFRKSTNGPPYDLFGYVTLADLQDANNPTFTLTNLEKGFQYFFAATAYDTDGNESDYSNSVCAEVSDNIELCGGGGGGGGGGGCFIGTIAP